MATVELAGVVVRQDGAEILRGIDLVVGHGEVLAIVGPTGSGKTTLLRAISGLQRLAAGAVRFDGRDVSAVPPPDRDVAFVFQRPALLPNRDAGRNIALPLEFRHDPVAEIRKRVGAEARALHIEHLLGMRPDQLAEGQARAVQIARSLVKQPSVLLLDEPFSNIDVAWSSHLRREVMMIQRALEVTTVAAFNDPAEALTMGDRLAVLEQGAVVQHGTPLEVYDHPRTVTAAHLSGDADVNEVTVEVDDLGAWLVSGDVRVRAWMPALRAFAGRRLQMITRPEWWEVDEQGSIRLRVIRSVHLAGTTSVVCRLGRGRVTVRFGPTAGPSEGQVISVRLDRYQLIDPRDGFAIEA